ncbi:MAG TPA: hypothetical protein VGJ67_02680 [Actinomycetota bacterium]
MKRSVPIALSIFVVAVLAWNVLGGSGVAGPGRKYLTIAAPSFTGHNSSMHNDGNANPADACASQTPLDIGDENRGDLQNATGSFIAAIRFPDGSKIAQFSLIANDADADFNSAAYLIQKRVTDNLSPAKGGYNTLLEAHTKGAVTDTLRTFSGTPSNPISVDNARNMYYVELVSCAKTVEPFAVRAAYTT